jgi:hypothetical protein
MDHAERRKIGVGLVAVSSAIVSPPLIALWMRPGGTAAAGGTSVEEVVQEM